MLANDTLSHQWDKQAFLSHTEPFVKAEPERPDGSQSKRKGTQIQRPPGNSG